MGLVSMGALPLLETLDEAMLITTSDIEDLGSALAPRGTLGRFLGGFPPGITCSTFLSIEEGHDGGPHTSANELARLPMPTKLLTRTAGPRSKTTVSL